MKKHLLYSLLMAFCLTHFQKMTAQVYGFYADGIHEIDLCNCTIDDEVIGPTNVAALAMGINQDLYYLDSDNGDFVQIDLTTGTSTVVGVLPPNFFSVSMVYGPDGLLYLTGVDNNNPVGETLFSLDPTSGSLTNLGNLPAGIFMQGDLFFYGGLLYGLASDNNGSLLIQIPITNPAGTVTVHDLPNLSNLVGGISVFINGVETVFSIAQAPNSINGIIELDISSGGSEFACNGAIGNAGDLAAPPNYEVPPCCNNDAGSFSSTNFVSACTYQNITLTHLGDEILNPDAALSFILFDVQGTNFPDDVLQISSSPTFVFDPAYMLPNVGYHVAAVAAPGTPGNPDWTGDCIDFSLYALVAWYATPTVTFTMPQNEVCAGECQSVVVNLTGTEPFELTYNSPAGQQTATFSDNSGTLQICPPAGFLGNFTVEAISLSDANCVCQ